MYTREANAIQVHGSSYEIGIQLANNIKKDADKMSKYIGTSLVTKQQVDEINELLKQWCPGLCEEIQGFADTCKVPLESLVFYQMSSFVPACSHIAMRSDCVKEGTPLLARNYEFSDETEDFCLIRTEGNGRYKHMGTSMLLFGRDDGCNEQGLAVTMSACGLPVANLPHMKKPQFKGLQYWVVVRSLLENCKNVEEALAYLVKMPIVFNMNLLLLDWEDHMAHVQTMDGRIDIRKIDPDQAEMMIHATNHSILPQAAPLETKAFTHSIQRYAYIEQALQGRTDITKTELKDMLLCDYPKGLCFHNYAESFGTTKSMILSPRDLTIELCWGGEIENTWELYDITKPVFTKQRTIKINPDKRIEHLFAWSDTGTEKK